MQTVSTVITPPDQLHIWCLISGTPFEEPALNIISQSEGRTYIVSV
jgi:hypothetical protein